MEDNGNRNAVPFEESISGAMNWRTVLSVRCAKCPNHAVFTVGGSDENSRKEAMYHMERDGWNLNATANWDRGYITILCPDCGES